MSDVIKGYQFSPVDGRFIGEYEFPNNQDRDEIHLPPFTTLKPPPVGDADDIAFWRGAAWELVVVPQETFVPPIGDYLLVADSFIEYLKAVGRWTDEDQAKRDAALAEFEANKSVEGNTNAA